MIAKGASRAAPAQLASYLLRTETRDGPQRVEVLELQSGTDSLRETFLDWHSVGLGTRGEKTLYHAQISPDPRYKMTPEQYLRAADILGEKLGLQDHPRVVVLHDDGEQPHLHIVWQRADVETMTMWDDGHNYRKHEQASLRMEQEFGHEFVPGKHAKRDRKKQPEFPRAESTQDEQKQAQRTDMTFDERKEQITALRATADNAQAFKNALEETGYVLAKGDRRGFVVVDEQGDVFSLSKHVADLKDKAFKEFMAPIDRDQLPSVDEAKARQQERAQPSAPEATEKQQPPAPPPEEQQVKHTGEALSELKAQLAAMKADAGSPQAFSAALEKAGYVLASGDRGYTVVDENGGAYNLARQLKLKLAEINEFMVAIDLKTLPSVDEAKALQALKRDQEPEMALNARKPAPEASKFLPPDLAQKLEQPTPAPEEPAPAPRKSDEEKEKEQDRKNHIQGLKTFSESAVAFKAALEDAGFTLARGNRGYLLVDQAGEIFGLASQLGERKALVDAYMSPIPLDTLPAVEDIKAKDSNLNRPAPPPPAPEPADEELRALKTSLAARQAAEIHSLVDRHALEIRQTEREHDREILLKMADYKVLEDDEKRAYADARKEHRKTVQTILDAIERRWNPQLAAEKTQQREKDRQAFYSRLVKERTEYQILIQAIKKQDIENLIGRQRQQLADLTTGHKKEETEYVREHHEAKRISAEREAKRIQDEMEKKDDFREGLPPPRRGK